MHAAIMVIGGMLAATPASTQGGGTYGPTLSPPPVERVDRLLDEVRDDIRQARRDGRLSRAQAKVLRRDARRIDAVEDRYAADGLSASEAAELRNRADALRSLATAAAPPGKPR